MSAPARAPLPVAPLSPDLTERLAKSWWAFLVRGILALAFGAFALYVDTMVSDLILRAIAFVSLVVAFCFYLFCSGVLELAAYLAPPRGGRHSSFLLLDAVLGFLMCALTFFLPGVTTETVPRVVGAYAMLLGANELGIGVRVRRHTRARYVIVSAAVLMLAMGAFLLIFHTFDSVRLVHRLALAAFAIGLLSIWTAWEFRRDFAPAAAAGRA